MFLTLFIAPTTEDILRDTLSIWAFHDIFSLITKPKKSKFSTFSMTTPLTDKFNFGILERGVWGYLNVIYLVFPTFKDSLFADNHSKIKFISAFILGEGGPLFPLENILIMLFNYVSSA